MAPDDTGDELFETLWKRVLEAWDDDKPHGAALEYAVRSEQLPILAGRYRALQEDPDKGARAKKKLDALVVAATQMLMATKTPPPGKAPRGMKTTALFMFLVVLGWIAYFMYMRR